MPKDLTKASLRELEVVSSGDFDQRTHWSNGALELTVAQATGLEGDEDPSAYDE